MWSCFLARFIVVSCRYWSTGRLRREVQFCNKGQLSVRELGKESNCPRSERCWRNFKKQHSYTFIDSFLVHLILLAAPWLQSLLSL
jgi:hypothetical protein